MSHRECDVVSVYDSMLNFSSDSEWTLMLMMMMMLLLFQISGDLIELHKVIAVILCCSDFMTFRKSNTV